jgi:hypothetical protein
MEWDWPLIIMACVGAVSAAVALVFFVLVYRE